MFMIDYRYSIWNEGSLPILINVTIISCERMPDGRFL